MIRPPSTVPARLRRSLRLLVRPQIFVRADDPRPGEMFPAARRRPASPIRRRSVSSPTSRATAAAISGTSTAVAWLHSARKWS